MRMTKDEILLVVIVLAALLSGAAAKHYRNTHHRLKVDPSATPARPSSRTAPPQ